ncbi:MAG TPA: Gfo/Idh/MocA family oxidoreductase [Sumerlaeia bacterium]|nr:Gfo/Idh/MocA family oxidoreductase [Sumerlaeia bacterium]
MARRVIRFGVIGGGLMGREIASAAARWCHLLDLRVKPEIVAVCSKPASTLEWFSENLETVKQTTTDYRELLENPDVEAVYCAVPHNLHRQMYVDAIEAGKHLLGEKPFGIDRAANAVISQAIAGRPDLVARCSSQFPFFPGVQRIVKALKEGRFGAILEVECGFLHSSDADPNKPINWKRIVEINGEYGCMGDLGLHVFHVPLRAGWRPKNVRAVLSNIIRERKNAEGRLVPCETWDNATLLCEMDGDGGVFPLTAKTQRIAPGETNTWYLTILGTRFSARFTTKRPRTLETLAYEPGGPQIWQTEDLGYESVYKTITGGIFEFGFSDAILQMLAAFCDQIAQGNDAQLPFGCATPQEAAQTHEIFTAALESQRTGQVAPIGDGD